ncbi:MAG TPA: arsenite methyltransferase [Planctomycetota bacterium]|nr:arsenite methyltransferase [Planctomycetota bacterium]
MDPSELRDVVRSKYGEAARRAASGERSSCCGSSSSPLDGGDPITRDLYGSADAALLPTGAVEASLGCGNPTALAELRPGETVLDLGSGGGADVLLSAKRVGPTGKAFGLDMTPEMLELARANQERAGVANAEFLRGTIEAIPLPDRSVDVVVSNCVINLSGDKDRVLREAFRVLRPGGRFAVSDVVTHGELPEPVRASMAMWTGCVAGALSEAEYVSKLRAAGFDGIEVQPTRVYGREDFVEMARACGDAASAPAVDALAGLVFSAFVRARKPAR